MLQDILLRVKQRNDEYAGEWLREVNVLLNGDTDMLAARGELRAWADRYVAKRIARGHPKDEGDCVLTYLRLYDELTPWLEELAFQTRGDTLHALYLDEVTDYIPWLLYIGTWGKEMTFEPADGGFRLDWGTIEPAFRPYLIEHLKLYSWGVDASLALFAEALGGSGTDKGTPLVDLAADIAEMRPLLVRNYRPERTVTQVGESLFIAWMWNLQHRVGTVVAGSSEREVLERVASGVAPMLAHIALDGSVRHFALPWQQLDTLPSGAVATRRLVEAVHARLFGFYDQIDFEALTRPGRRPPVPEASVTDEAEDAAGHGDSADAAAIAASVDLLRRRDAEEPSGRLGVRTSQLLAVLDRLGCEVRQGKGSEVPSVSMWVRQRPPEVYRAGRSTDDPDDEREPQARGGASDRGDREAATPHVHRGVQAQDPGGVRGRA